VAPAAVTLEIWIRRHWLPTIQYRVKPSTFDSYRRNLELHVIPELGQRQLSSLTPLMLDKLYAELLDGGNRNRSAGLSSKSVRYIHTIIHKALADAVDSDLLGQNVAERAKPPQPRTTISTELRFWEPAELRIFLEQVAGHRLEASWHLAAMTGMRRGEILGLRWKDVDLENARVSIRQALVSVAYEVIASTPKNHQARVIDLDAGTVELLRSHQQHQRSDKDEWGREYIDQDLVFCKGDGSPLHPQSFSQAFERLVAGSALPKIRLHDLRHTHATIALRAGVPVKVVSERLGHETPAFTLKQYAHVIPGMQAEAAKQIATVVRGS
jgi:integrase